MHNNNRMKSSEDHIKVKMVLELVEKCGQSIDKQSFAINRSWRRPPWIILQLFHLFILRNRRYRKRTDFSIIKATT